MNPKDPHNCISYLNFCSREEEVNQKVKLFFEKQNYTVLSYLKELNNYVVITADYPIDRTHLLKALDPYRKFSDTILLIIVFNQKPVTLSFPWNLTEFGISEIVFVDEMDQILEHVQTHFSRYIAINRLIKNEDQKKTNNQSQTLQAGMN